MDIMELAGKQVKICRASITVKDDNGKTRGMVRGLRKFKDCPARDQLDVWDAMRKSGLWGGKFSNADHVFVDGKGRDAHIYYIYNTREDDHFHKYGHIYGDDEPERTRYNERQKWLQKLKTFCDKITVIPCVVLD